MNNFEAVFATDAARTTDQLNCMIGRTVESVDWGTSDGVHLADLTVNFTDGTRLLVETFKGKLLPHVEREDAWRRGT